MRFPEKVYRGNCEQKGRFEGYTTGGEAVKNICHNQGPGTSPPFFKIAVRLGARCRQMVFKALDNKSSQAV